jgi:hypothetical protein
MTGKKTSESKAQSQPSQFRRQARNTYHLTSGIKNNINSTLHGVGRFYLLTPILMLGLYYTILYTTKNSKEVDA